MKVIGIVEHNYKTKPEKARLVYQIQPLKQFYNSINMQN